MSTRQDDPERDPLLKNSEETKPNALPWRPIVVLLLLNAAQPLAYELVFPFINQMLLELKVVDDPERVGFYSGVIESVFAVTSLITIFPASYASDRFGRKPVILIGISGLGVSLLFFGTSRSYLALVLSRCIGGGMGGVWAAVKVMLGELTDKTNQHAAFSFLMIAYRMGQIIGLPIGGFLAHPERHWPGTFDGEFWTKYPFALPCFVGAGFAFFAVLCGMLLVEETLQRSPQAPAHDSKIIVHTDESGDVVPEIIIDDYPAPTPTPAVGWRDVLTKEVISLLASNLLMCAASEGLFTVYPLFAFTPIESGGLSFSESRIGGYLSIRAMIQIGIMLVYPYLLRNRFIGRGSAVRMYKFGMFIWPTSILIYPLLNLLARSVGTKSWIFEVCMMLFFIAWGFGGYCWTTMGVMSNDASPSAQALAKLAGALQVSVVIPQAIVPALTTSLFALSVDHQILGGYFHWIVYFVITFAGAIHALSLEEVKHDWRADRDAAAADAKAKAHARRSAATSGSASRSSTLVSSVSTIGGEEEEAST